MCGLSFGKINLLATMTSTVATPLKKGNDHFHLYFAIIVFNIKLIHFLLPRITNLTAISCIGNIYHLFPP